MMVMMMAESKLATNVKLALFPSFGGYIFATVFKNYIKLKLKATQRFPLVQM